MPTRPHAYVEAITYHLLVCYVTYVGYNNVMYGETKGSMFVFDANAALTSTPGCALLRQSAS